MTVMPGDPVGRALAPVYNRYGAPPQDFAVHKAKIGETEHRIGSVMCGIVGYLDKRGGQHSPVGDTLLAMLQALSCRGPDSVGVASFGPLKPAWLLQVKLPEKEEPA